MDMSASIAPKSDQLDSIELVAGPRTFTIQEITRHNAEQPWNVHLAEFPRPWRPSKSMLRVMVAAWGLDGTAWVGQRVTLYCDPSVQFGSEMVGGTRISHMSGLNKALKLPLLIKRGKSAVFTVQPLSAAPAPVQESAVEPVDWSAEAEKLKGNTDALRALYTTAQQHKATPEQLAHIKTCATPEPTQEAAPE